MKGIESKIIFSSLFFFFVAFVLLSLIVSSLSATFSQLFLVFSYPHRAYDFISNLLLLCFVAMCGGFIIYSIRHKKHNTTEKLTAFYLWHNRATCADISYHRGDCAKSA